MPAHAGLEKEKTTLLEPVTWEPTSVPPVEFKNIDGARPQTPAHPALLLGGWVIKQGVWGAGGCWGLPVKLETRDL